MNWILSTGDIPILLRGTQTGTCTLSLNTAAFWLQPALVNFDVSPNRQDLFRWLEISKAFDRIYLIRLYMIIRIQRCTAQCESRLYVIVKWGTH